MKLIKDVRDGSTKYATEAEVQKNSFFELVDTIVATAGGFLEKTEDLVDGLEDVIESVTGKKIDLNGNEPKKPKTSKKPKKDDTKAPTKPKDGPIEIEQDIE